MAQPDGSGAAIPGDRDADRHWLAAAIDLSRRCPPSQSAFSVGALVVAASGQVIATGYSRETGSKDHAEEVALRRATGAGITDPAAATLYSSLEPCLGSAA
jgi:pyrimidine deaminase RibD-like protein